MAAVCAGPARAESTTSGEGGGSSRPPDLLLVTVDTLRADHLGAWGHSRPTSPNIDLLAASGARFTAARTIEPLTTPAIASLLTSTAPHTHGATRNGLPIRPLLPSLPRLLARRGYSTVALVGNWTLKDELSGLAAHWHSYEAVVSRKRWFGLLKDEADATDLTDAAIARIESLRARDPARPFLLWVHYVEPHAPYRLHREIAGRLGIDRRNPSAIDRYDTEIAAVDAEIGRLLRALDHLAGGHERLSIFLADHGEAFGENGEQGHGRILHQPTLRIPLAISWPGRIRRRVVTEPVTILDLAPTVLALLDLPEHPYFQGAPITALAGADRPRPPVCFQAHKGAVQSLQSSQRARRAGLLEVGVLDGRSFEALELGSSRRRRFDLESDPQEIRSEVPPGSSPSMALSRCLEQIRSGLADADRFVPPTLESDAIEELRALGYLD